MSLRRGKMRSKMSKKHEERRTMKDNGKLKVKG
jgi:hypothetical protein